MSIVTIVPIAYDTRLSKVEKPTKEMISSTSDAYTAVVTLQLLQRSSVA